MDNIFIREKSNMHAGVKGFVLKDNAGDYTIFVNEALNDETKRKTIHHELQHISKQHFQQAYRSVRELEEEIG